MRRGSYSDGYSRAQKVETLGSAQIDKLRVMRRVWRLVGGHPRVLGCVTMMPSAPIRACGPRCLCVRLRLQRQAPPRG